MRVRIILCIAIILFLAGHLFAQGSTNWVASKSGKWSNPTNWAGEVLPSPSVKAYFDGPSECIIDIPDASAWQIDLGGGPLKIVNGGNLTVYDWFILGYNTGDVDENAGRLEVHDGGVLNCLQRLFVGYRAEGYLTIFEGGTVNIHAQLLGVGRQTGGNGVVTLEGGLLNFLEGTDDNSLGIHLETAQHIIDFRGGAMSLRDTSGNRNSLDRGVNDGTINAYGGIGEVVVDPNEQPGKLVVRGIHPLRPNPTDDGIASAGQVQLSWILPDPCTPGQAVAVDVYFTDDLQALQQFIDPAAIRVVNKQSVSSVTVQTQPKKRYYWAVDSYVGGPADPVYGPIFSFIADNLPPQVNAGTDIVTWLESGPRTGSLDATVIDDDAYTVQWTVVSEPNVGDAVILNPNVEDASVTVSALGQYVLQLDASDGEYSNSDTVTINVYEDSCQAAQSLPNYVPLVGDLNGDCKVDDADMALLQENWLADNSLTDEWFGL